MNTRAEYISEIRNLPKKLRDVLNGLTEDQLDTPYGEGKWTPRQVVHHLADSHMHSYMRMKFIITENHPTIKTYNQEDWATLSDAKNYSVDASLNIIDGLHARWTNFLSSLNDTDWDRTAFHPERGEIKLDSFLKLYAEHGNKHVGHIQGLRSSKGW